MNRNFNDYKFSPSLKLRSRKITRSAETAQHKAENVTTTTSSSMTVKTHTLPETIETTSESTSMRFGEQTASSLTDISTSHSTNTASNTILNDFNKSDEEELNESIIFPSLQKKILKIKIVSVIFKILKGSKKDEHLFSQI